MNGPASPFDERRDALIGVYRMLGCSRLFPVLYQGHCKQQVLENAGN
jgi:hypothetical protein